MKASFKALYIFIICCINIETAKAQGIQVVPLQTADSLLKVRSYKKSAEFYFMAFAHTKATQTDNNLLSASIACANARKVDSAFKFLLIIANRSGRIFHETIAYSPVFSKLWKDPRWDQLVIKLENGTKGFNTPVANELCDLYKERNLMDLKIKSLTKEYGKNSNNYKTYQDSINRIDKDNTIKIKSILNTYGWMTVNEIDKAGVKSLIYLFMRLKFNDQKMYYPMISTSFKAGGIDAENYAVISDKISLSERREQIYGTQLNEPIMNKDSLNFRRLSIGLQRL